MQYIYATNMTKSKVRCYFFLLLFLPPTQKVKKYVHETIMKFILIGKNLYTFYGKNRGRRIKKMY